MRHFTFILLSAIMLFSVTSCKSTRQSVSKPSAGKNAIVDKTGGILKDLSTDWETVQVPMTIYLSSPVSFKGNARVYMSCDNSIYLSFTILGMEMAAIQITNDSVIAVDKMHKRYVAESLESVTSNYPVSISTLQSIFMGQTFLPGHQHLSASNLKDFKTKILSDNERAVIPVKQYSPYNLTFLFDSDYVLKECQIKSPDSDLRITYSDETGFLSGSVPQTDEITFKTSKTKIAASLVWNWNKARINNPSDNKKIKLNSSYSKVSLSQLLKSFN